MAVQPFKGNRQEWLVENGFVPVIHATAGRWQLREYVTKSPGEYVIAETTSLLTGVGWIGYDVVRRAWETHREGQVFYGATPLETFEWWVAGA